MNSNIDEHWQDLCVAASELVEAKKVPGLSLGVWVKGRSLTAGFGVTNIDHPLPATDETLFQIGSITKTLTGTLMMQLVEAGELDLDATVRTYLPDFRVADEDASAQATIRHLLTHMGGWVGDFFHDTGPGDDALSRYVAAMEELEQLAPLGTVWSYNNAGFGVAGAVIERVTGQSYQRALRDRLLEPLGLSHAFLDPGQVMTHRFAVGHGDLGEGIQVLRPWVLPRAVYPIGGLICHIKDLLRYAAFHLGDGTADKGERLLESHTLSAMRTPQVVVRDKESRGLAWAIDDTYGPRIISHGGGTKGQISGLFLVPEHNFAAVILTNSENGDEAVTDLSRLAFKLYHGMEIKDPVPIEATEADLSPYVGRYHRPYMDIDVGLLGGKLVAQINYLLGFPTQDSPPAPSPPPMSMAMYGEDRLLVMDGPYKNLRCDIIRREDGSIGWLRTTRLHRRVE